MSVRTRAVALGAGLTLAATAALVTATPALAKSGVTFTATPRTVHVGQSIGLYAAGGDDSFGDYTEVCIEQYGLVNHRRQWVVLRCTAPTPGYAGGESLHLTLRFNRPLRVGVRAQLVQTDARGGHRQGRQATAQIILTVVR